MKDANQILILSMLLFKQSMLGNSFICPGIMYIKKQYLYERISKGI